MSTAMPEAARSEKSAWLEPGWSGTFTSVYRARLWRGPRRWRRGGFVGGEDERAGDVLEARPHHHLDAELLGELDRPRTHHAGAEAGQFEHLVVGDRVEPPGLREHPRVGGVDAIHVGVDLAQVGVEHGCEGYGRRVGAAAAERGDVAILVDALKAGGDDDRPGIEKRLHMIVEIDLMRALVWVESVRMPIWCR